MIHMINTTIDIFLSVIHCYINLDHYMMYYNKLPLGYHDILGTDALCTGA